MPCLIVHSGLPLPSRSLIPHALFLFSFKTSRGHSSSCLLLLHLHCFSFMCSRIDHSKLVSVHGALRTGSASEWFSPLEALYKYLNATPYTNCIPKSTTEVN